MHPKKLLSHLLIFIGQKLRGCMILVHGPNWLHDIVDGAQHGGGANP